MVTIVSYGGGVDSTGLLCGMVRGGMPEPHAILFADTGGEWPETYAYIKMFSEWLVANYYPPVTIVKKGGNKRTLEEDCLVKNMLPSIAYGRRGCSLKFKAEPQEKWANNDPVCRNEWSAGRKVVKALGYDWGEVHRAKFYDDPKYQWSYPLIDWKWDRAKCAAAILDCQLPLPSKSACFFCPSSKPREVRELAQQHPDLLQRALAMEAGAKLKTVAGLGRDFRWADVVAQGEMFPAIYEKRMTERPCECFDGAVEE